MPHAPELGENRLARRTPLTLLLVSLIVALAIGVTQQAAAAAPKVNVAGGYSVDLSQLPSPKCAPVGGSETLLRCAVAGLVSTYTGSLDGATTSSFTQVIDCVAGRTVGQGVETFTGTVGGKTGTLRWRLAFTAKFDCAASVPSGFVGLGQIVKGTGGLASLRGALVFDDTTYHGWLH